MATFLVISDVHANYPALQAVLDDAPATDGVIFCGDAVGLCGFPAATVETLRDLFAEDDQFALQGNHDLSVIEWGEGHVNDEALSLFELDTTLNGLTHEQQVWVNDRPTYVENRELGVQVAHAWPTPEKSSGLERGNHGVQPGDFVTVGARAPEWVDIICTGHTHTQHGVDCRRFGHGHDVTVVNPGCVGYPVDRGRADYAVIDTKDASYELHTAEYDSRPVLEQLRVLDVPKQWWR